MTAFYVVLPVLSIIICFTEKILGDSDLRSAVEAVDRRQRELSEYEAQQQYPLGPYEQYGELSFLSNAADGEDYDRDYLDDDNYDPYSKRLTSSFRERLEEDREKQMEELARNFYNNLENDRLDNNELRELWERYNGKGPYYNKRYYPIYGMQNVGLRKRGRFIESDEEPVYSIHHHVPRTDNDYQMRYKKHLKSSYTPFRNDRFTIAKRSSPINKNEKRQTDPRVENDLKNIFGSDKDLNEMHSNKLGEGLSTSKSEVTLPPRKIEKKDKPKMDANKELDLNKEVFAPVSTQNKKPLQLKKKSIDWSDYFGLDRRKKSDSNDLDKEWLMERYHKAVAVTAKKRNAELPLQSFRNHDVLIKEGKEEQKIKELDAKLEKLEDEIVEDALKYTGAHQDYGDSKEIQQVKENIIARLAQAYNIEKMRNALEEYKTETTNVRKEVDKSQNDYSREEKRVSVPRKQAIDETRDPTDGDNNIKCTTASEDCHEQNYKLPSDILDFTSFDCPAIQRGCNDVASVVGYYGHVFEAACHIHQLCLLCVSILFEDFHSIPVFQ
ncbi:hypothetical protein ABEB36_011331 [Hypothenemus hampei]|uniref:Uncharacterized protein n=1 Tax=Hypothenemus hampei TaxID=57062 RepID=A0ABD1EF14_HYPHA